jgi:hypothetical protein
MPPALECRRQPQPENFVGEPERHDAAAHGEHVGVVVCARQPRGIKFVAKRGPNARHLVGRYLLALTAAAQYDAAVRTAFSNGPGDVNADRRIVDRRFAVGAVIVDHVAEALERALQMLFERKARVIGANRNAHNAQVYYGFWGSRFCLSGSGFGVRGSASGA